MNNQRLTSVVDDGLMRMVIEPKRLARLEADTHTDINYIRVPLFQDSLAKVCQSHPPFALPLVTY